MGAPCRCSDCKSLGRTAYGRRKFRGFRRQRHGRAQLNDTLPRLEHYMVVGFMGGAILNADRFSAFRVGGALPFTSEFPFYLPGYFFEELSTEDFGLAYD